MVEFIHPKVHAAFARLARVWAKLTGQDNFAFSQALFAIGVLAAVIGAGAGFIRGDAGSAAVPCVLAALYAANYLAVVSDNRRIAAAAEQVREGGAMPTWLQRKMRSDEGAFMLYAVGGVAWALAAIPGDAVIMAPVAVSITLQATGLGARWAFEPGGRSLWQRTADAVRETLRSAGRQLAPAGS